MAYYLKKTVQKGRTYLSICESYYHPEKKQTAQKLYKSYGSVETLKANGMVDPIAFYQAEVDKLNEERKKKLNADKQRKISSSPVKNLGYFPLKSIYDELSIKKYLNLLQITREFRFSISDLVEALLYSRAINPCSKIRTYEEVIPLLFDDFNLSYHQILSGLEFIGQEYEKIVEIFTAMTDKKYGLDTSNTYFDCTNFYFEIDREDNLKKKGPSKENRRDPIVGMGLLLDAEQIPISMKIYPGNQSEKPVLRDVIASMKNRNNITGRTIQIADKGLNCGDNIYAALKSGDGYLFSKSVKMLPETEKTWVLLDNDYKNITDKDGKLLYRIKSCVDSFPYTIHENGKTRKVTLTEKRIVTFNPKLAEKKKYEIEKLVAKAKLLRQYNAKRSEYGECSKYVNFKSTDEDGKITESKVKVLINQDAIDNDIQLAGYNMLVTSESKAEDEKIYDTYHNLWRIEESFKVMKSELDARPVYLQKENSVKGHFLICYLAVLLERLFQFKVLNGKYCTSKIYKFIRDFKVVKTEGSEYINISTANDFISAIEIETGLPVTNYFLKKAQIKKMLAHKFK